MKILTILGTRPEAIKLAPFIKAVEADKQSTIIVCTTTQHREMQDSVLSLFNIIPKYDLNIMKPKQDLFYLTSSIIDKIKPVLEKENPDFVVVQGDTTTAFAGALSAFYKKIPVVHIEAGLRTSNIFSPFPEEANRALISKIASIHFAPTQRAVDNLKQENIHKNVFKIGNTIVDSVYWILNQSQVTNVQIRRLLDSSSSKILITVHRRENFGPPLLAICEAIKCICDKYSDMEFIWPVHPNPNVKGNVFGSLKNINNLTLTPPLLYTDIIHIINKCEFILSDSGGIQEEAMILQKPILVLRDTTERYEVIESGLGFLVGCNKNKIIQTFSELIIKKSRPKIRNVSIYGDPGVATNILKIVKGKLPHEVC